MYMEVEPAEIDARIDEIDAELGTLESRRNELLSERDRAITMRDMLKMYGKPVLTPEVMQPALQLAPAPTPAPSLNGHSNGEERARTPGLRRAVTMALNHSPSTEKELAKALAWNQKKVSEVVSSMLSKHLCQVMNGDGKLDLTPAGKIQAQWFIDNPKKLIYLGGDRTAAVQQT